MASHADYKRVKRVLGFDLTEEEDGLQVTTGDMPEFLWMDTPKEVEEFGNFLVKEGQKLIAQSKKMGEKKTASKDPWKA